MRTRLVLHGESHIICTLNYIAKITVCFCAYGWDDTVIHPQPVSEYMMFQSILQIKYQWIDI